MPFPPDFVRCRGWVLSSHALGFFFISYTCILRVYKVVSAIYMPIYFPLNFVLHYLSKTFIDA